MKLLLSALCIVFAVSQVRLVAQPQTPGGAAVLIGTSDEYGVRVADRPAIVIDTDKVVVPSLYLWGATEIRLTHGETALQVKRISEVQGQYVSIITFKPPVPPNEVQTIATTFKRGAWLRRDGTIPAAKGDARVRVLHLKRHPAAITYAVTLDAAAAAGSAFYDTDGALVGILAVSASWGPSYSESMSLCPGQDLAAHVAWLNEHELGEGEFSPTSWRESSSPSLSEFSRLFLGTDASADALERIAARWNEEDPDWSKSLTQELYFMLMSVARNHKVAHLLRQMVQDPPEFWESGSDRFRLAKAIVLINNGSIAEGGAELRALADEGGPTKFIACLLMADLLSLRGHSAETQYKYLEKAKTEYAYDPLLYEIATRTYAKHFDTMQDEYSNPDTLQDLYHEVSEKRQRLDWSVSASLTPATQLLEWELYEQAAEFARTGVERWPDDVDCREALVRALVGMDDIESARGHLIELRRRDPERATKLVESIPSLGDR